MINAPTIVERYPLPPIRSSETALSPHKSAAALAALPCKR
jgi:hypothetical protein